MTRKTNRQQRGYTLIDVLVGMVILAISLAAVIASGLL